MAGCCFGGRAAQAVNGGSPPPWAADEDDDVNLEGFNERPEHTHYLRGVPAAMSVQEHMPTSCPDEDAGGYLVQQQLHSALVRIVNERIDSTLPVPLPAGSAPSAPGCPPSKGGPFAAVQLACIEQWSCIRALSDIVSEIQRPSAAC